MASISHLIRALGQTLVDQSYDLLSITLGSLIRQQVRNAVPKAPASRWLLARQASQLSVDGAVMNGTVEGAFAKYALPKGLPVNPGERRLAVENEPHTITDFDGEILSGYGKGTKRLLWSGIGMVKIKGKAVPAKVNYHEHDADVAGLHYDLVAEGVPPGTEQWELHIPKGEYKGRYAFVTTPKGMLVIPMKDNGLVLPKPDYSLKNEDFLTRIPQEELGQWIFEHKKDGSLGNAVIKDDHAVFRSHRDSGQTYYDRLPQLEHIGNRSRFLGFRLMVPGPQQDGTVIQGELYHPDGAGRMGGILNAMPDKAQEIQKLRGPATYHVWDVVKYRGKDVSHLPYAERRVLLESIVKDIRRFNPHWHAIRAASPGEDPHAFYKEITSLPLPNGEGIVVKRALDPAGQTWFKVKQRDAFDVEVIDILPGNGKYAGSVGRFVVRDPASGGIGEVGSFRITDERRQWIWDNRDKLIGSVAKIDAQEMTKRGVPRAGVFLDFHEGKGSETGLLMYAESLAGGDPEDAERTKYALIIRST